MLCDNQTVTSEAGKSHCDTMEQWTAIFTARNGEELDDNCQLKPYIDLGKLSNGVNESFMHHQEHVEQPVQCRTV